ncbi:MAG: NUDIX hydrolase [Salibacteraceae bacterium]
MNFNFFINTLKHKLSDTPNNLTELMGEFYMGDRIKMLNANPNPRLSAVMIMLYEKNKETYFTLIERPKYDGVHSGQIAFPGGSKDENDKNLEYTAVRELNEEVGITDEIEIIGSLSEVYIPPSKFLVTPFIGVLKNKPTYIKDDFEVETIIETPLSLILDDSIVKKGWVHVGNNKLKMKVPYFDIYGHMVWGATAIILSELKAILK